MYFLVNYLQQKEKKIYICDTFKTDYQHLSSYKETKIKKLLNNTHELTRNEIEEISNKWGKLYNENKDIRVIENKNIKSHTFKYLDDKILQLLFKLGSISYFELIGLCIKNKICGFCGDCIFEERINYLIDTNKIKVNKIILSKNIMNEDIYKKYISVNNVK